MIDIVIPRPVPDGYRARVGEMPGRPVCERCMRPSTERNPISLLERPAWGVRGPEMRRDALCMECRLILSRSR